MRILIKILLGVVLTMALLVGFIWLKPMTASSILWSTVEDFVLDDFVGITADGNVQPGLFPIQATGQSTENVVRAANTFIATLDEEQRGRALFAVDDLEWRRWANIHLSARQGVGFVDFNATQTQAALDLIASGLSTRGLQTAVDIMHLEGHLADLMDDYVQYGEKRYWLTIMGTPSTSEPWGWQLDGHHLIINFFVLGDQVVMTPLFMGSEPPKADSGRYAGTEILLEEQQAGLRLVNSLDQQQLGEAVLADNKSGNNNRGELFQDNGVVAYEGLVFSKLREDQKQLAVDLIGWHINKMRAPHARIKMTEIVQHWDETRFAWIGATDADAVFYYRIHSPVVMIEYDHQLPIALQGPKVPSRNHVHTTVRTPNGNDYGKSLLRQHLEAHPH